LLAFRSDPILMALKDEPEYRKLLAAIHSPAPQAASAEISPQDDGAQDSLLASLIGK
jgi:hypothetical protein